MLHFETWICVPFFLKLVMAASKMPEGLGDELSCFILLSLTFQKKELFRVCFLVRNKCQNLVSFWNIHLQVYEQEMLEWQFQTHSKSVLATFPITVESVSAIYLFMDQRCTHYLFAFHLHPSSFRDSRHSGNPLMCSARC